MTEEKRVSYQTSNSYATLHSPGKNTRNLWLVFHGMGYLSRYFLKYFEELDSEENYLVAPQAPSKYYLGPEFKHVGASWLTREDTVAETRNVLNYVDAVWEAERQCPHKNFFVLGYSQGVSIATRWLSSRKIQCDRLVLHSGGIPVELTPVDFEYLDDETKVTYIYGDKDEYITEARKTEQQLRGNKLFGELIEYEVFDGKHEVNRDFLERIAKL